MGKEFIRISSAQLSLLPLVWTANEHQHLLDNTLSLSLYGIGPAYLNGSCVPPVATNTARSTLRSAQRSDLIVQRTRNKFGRRGFRVGAPSLLFGTHFRLI